MKIMKPFYLKYPNIDESIFYQLNEQCNMLTETYHQLTKFDVYIRHIVKHIIKNFNHLEDFYTGYVWDSLKNSCYGFKNEQSLENKINLFPIYVKFISSDINISMMVNGKTDEPDRIVIEINRDFLQVFNENYDEKEDIDSDSDSDEENIFDNEYNDIIKRYRSLFRGRDLSSVLYADLKHEFVHIYHSYMKNDIDMLIDPKNISSAYTINDFPPYIRNLISSGSILERLRGILYFNAPTEREARINATIGYLDGLDYIQASHFINTIKKKYNICDNERWRLVEATEAELVYFTKLDEYRNVYESISNDYDFHIYKRLILCAYLLFKFKLYRTHPAVDDGFMMKYYDKYLPGANVHEHDRIICRDTLKYLKNGLLDFKRKINDIVYDFLKRNNFID